MNDALNWFEIPVSDFERAVAFYEEIFSFEMFRMDIGDGTKMALFPSEPGRVGGALACNPEFYHPDREKGSLVYLNADPDLQTVQDKIEGAGGEVMLPKRQISEEHGYMAVFYDSEGNRMALHSSG